MTSPTTSTTVTLQSLAGQGLALVPLVVGLLFGALVLPRSVPPDEIPAPAINEASLARTMADDDARALLVADAPLGSRLRSVGSAFRGFNLAEANHGDADTIAKARARIIDAVQGISAADDEPLLALRAFETRAFLTAVRGYERTGEVSDELRELGGTFVDRMEAVGWCVHHRVSMPEAVRRAAFKLTWNHTLFLDGSPRFALTLDETKALYGFYFRHPHAGQAERQRIFAATGASGDPLARARASDALRKASAAWVLTKIAELSKINPTYPSELATAAALYMKQDFRNSAVQYQSWLEAHPDGPWTLRAQNHLRAALLASQQAMR